MGHIAIAQNSLSALKVYAQSLVSPRVHRDFSDESAAAKG